MYSTVFNLILYSYPPKSIQVEKKRINTTAVGKWRASASKTKATCGASIPRHSNFQRETF